MSYVAYKRAGSLYGYCVDCEDAETWTLQTGNASDPSVTDDTAVEVCAFCLESSAAHFVAKSTIFSIDLDPSTQHTLMVYNLPDSVSGNSSEINLDHLFVQLQDNGTGN